MTQKIIVLVSDLDDAIHGEINVLESSEHAARFVESLLESGFDQERIRVFLGGEMDMEVHHRPVVSLMGTRPSKESSPDSEEQQEEAAEADQGEAAAKEETVAASSGRAARGLLIEAASAEPFTQNGVRFSSQFRPA
jgi:hypothetical protein